ncbi:hypothetical protein [Methylobacterium iners]|jgi:hypothetical protein|uniref:Molecular chaperone-like protein n=1 Tax=Methylobacterium iners TaxID=418707 RepID=A0ABQ4RVS3_9HYPH|nr:hypothetical protein [Methylobacterium iners]GJD94824.1 hypothetical protein OCOJLMKI_2030 [Methylobacterium iners]
MSRWLPLVATALIVIVAVVGIGLWKFDLMRAARVENDGRPAVPACDPANEAARAVLPECPDQSGPPPKAR